MTLAKQPPPPTRNGLLAEARHVVLPKGIASSGFPAVEATCQQLGLHFDSWQTDLNRCILGKAKSGLYAADTVVISIPRQVGKTWDIGALVFALCIIRPGITVVWTAHRFKVARETFLALKGIAESSELAPHIDADAITTAAGNESIPFRNGSRIVFAARERGAIRGFSEVEVLVLDEGQILTENAMADLAPTTNQAKNPLIIVMGTPPKPADPGEVFTRLRTDALEGDSDDVLYVEFSAEPGSDPDDHKAWAQANPSFPRRTSARAIQRLRKLLSDDDFVREALGVWDSDNASLVMPNWPDCAVEMPATAPTPVAVGLAVSIDRSWASIAAAASGSKIHLGSVDRRPGVAWVADELARIQAEHRCAVVLDEKGPAASLIDELEAANVILTRASMSDYLDACANLFDAVAEKDIEHANYSDLNESVKAAKTRPVGDRWAWARKGGDVSMLEAATLAAWAATEQPFNVY